MITPEDVEQTVNELPSVEVLNRQAWPHYELMASPYPTPQLTKYNTKRTEDSK